MENPLPYIFQLLDITHIPWFMPPPSPPLASQPAMADEALLPSQHITLTAILPLPSTFKNPCDDAIGPIWIIQRD